MSTVICNFNLFDLHQDICVIEDGGEIKRVAVSELGRLADDILDICEVKGIKKVHLIGDEEYANNSLIPAIRNRGNIKFSNNDLEIGVN